MQCGLCKHWLTGRKTIYQDGTEITTYAAPGDQGICRQLDMLTKALFGCVSFEPGSEHVEVITKDGAPWQHWKMIPCPSCAGSPGGGRCLCAGTGLTRQYDDGHIGDEHTRRHPREGTEVAQVDPGTVLAPLPKADPLAGATL